MLKTFHGKQLERLPISFKSSPSSRSHFYMEEKNFSSTKLSISANAGKKPLYKVRWKGEGPDEDRPMNMLNATLEPLDIMVLKKN